MDRKAYNEAVYALFARVGKAVGSPRRVQLLELLSQGERTVEVLAERAGLGVANASQHLQTLRNAGLVESHREGTYVVYRLAGDDVAQFLASLRALADSHLAEVERVKREYMDGRKGMEPMDSGALLDRVRAGEVTVIDVRPPEEYRAAHLPGAISVPLGELRRRLAAVPRDRDVVAYCRGPYCVLAVEAVETLRAEGFRAFHLEAGVAELRELGFTLASGE